MKTSTLIVAELAVLVLLLSLPTSQEPIFWIMPVGISVSIAKSDVNDGIGFDFV